MSDASHVKEEWVSALVDGELRDEEFARAIVYIEDSRVAREAWDTYHLVGEVLRSGKLETLGHDEIFIERLRRELTSNAHDTVAFEQDRKRLERVNLSAVPAANDSWWRRVAGLASVAFVGILVWQAAQWLGQGNSAGNTSTLAQAPAPAQASASSASSASLEATDSGGAVMLRDPQLDALLAAHRQHGGVTALQVPAGFLRNATFNEASR